MENLEQMRQEIDKIDDRIIEAFKERMALSAKIAKFKKDNNLPVLDAYREKEKLNRIAKNVDDDMSAFSSKLYLTLADLSREYQNNINKLGD